MSRPFFNDPCEQYHHYFRVYLRCVWPDKQEKWREILAKLKTKFPEGGCEHVVR